MTSPSHHCASIPSANHWPHIKLKKILENSKFLSSDQCPRKRVISKDSTVGMTLTDPWRKKEIQPNTSDLHLNYNLYMFYTSHQITKECISLMQIAVCTIITGYLISRHSSWKSGTSLSWFDFTMSTHRAEWPPRFQTIVF